MVWEIIDEDGTIYSGYEEEMLSKFNDIMLGREKLTWTGDLKLVEVHRTYS